MEDIDLVLTLLIDGGNEERNKDRFTGEVFKRKNNVPQDEYYIDWIIENLG